MAECIEREAILESVTVWYKKACQPENMSSYNLGERAAYITAISEIIELPAADVRPVVRGKWIDEHPDNPDDPRMRCSSCGVVEAPLMKWNFCPNCGADMREKS